MKQAPLFRRKFFIQKPAEGLPETESGFELLYLRVQDRADKPVVALHSKKVLLAAGGTFDVTCDSRGGAGLGRISYGQGLRAGLKQGSDFFTYRFKVPPDARPGTSYEVSCHGNEGVAAFRFVIEVDNRVPPPPSRQRSRSPRRIPLQS